ncbi:MAG: maleylacetoacetate isomerase [Pseudomonadota bacterium]
MKLYSYWRSSAAYRVRIALALKACEYETHPVNIAPGASEQLEDRFRGVNAQMRVPVLEVGGVRMIQSMAILNWLEETYPDPSLLPGNAEQRQRIRAFADVIACDIHPLNNLSVLKTLRQDFNGDDDRVSAWYSDWIHRGFRALEAMAVESIGGDYVFGNQPTMAEICLIPQMHNAHRFNVDLYDFPRLQEIEAVCLNHPAFNAALPKNQPDAT